MLSKNLDASVHEESAIAAYDHYVSLGGIAKRPFSLGAFSEKTTPVSFPRT